jgi:NAD(P)-dependent dehydrogenase (short-subunit alcohol dehydrogenase family)
MARSSSSRVVVVIGASSGIGRATAHELARRGDTLVLASRSADALADVERECLAAAPGSTRHPHTADAGGPAVLVVPTDVSLRGSVETLFERAVARYGRVDAVVNTAAVVGYGRFEDVPAEVYDQVIAVNLLGTANVARVALRLFQQHGGGHLVLVGSLLGKIATPWMSPYVTSKWAVHGLARTLQVEARQTPGVDVSLVSPGGVDTPIYAQAANYVGRVGRPPMPVDRPQTLARAIVKTLDKPARERSVGLANATWTAGFRFLPGVYDVLVGPGMSRLGLSTRHTTPHTGNVFAPLPAGEAVTGAWGRHWLRGVTVVGVAAGVVGVRRLLARG